MGNSTYWEIKVSLIAFRQVLTKILPAAFIQLHNYDCRIISQNHMPGISFLTKNVKKLLHPPGVDCPPFLWIFMGNPGDRGNSYTTVKILLISPIRKIPLNIFKSFAVNSFISSPSNSNFQIIILCNIYL